MEKRFNYAGFNLSDNEEAEQWIHDSVTKINFGFWDFNKLCDLLNEQEQKIKKYEEIMKKHNIVGVAKLDACLTDYLNVNEDTMSGKIIKQLKEKIKNWEYGIKMLKGIKSYDIGELLEKNIKLQQSQNSKAIEVLEKVRKFYNTNSDSDWIIDCLVLDEYINNQIKELGGKNG